MKPYRSKKYLKWVKSLPCVCSGWSADDANHIMKKGLGGMGTKASDLFTFPMSRFHHNMFHHDPKQWEEDFGDQWGYVMATLKLAIDIDIIDRDTVLAEIESQVKHTGDKEKLINEIG